MNDEPKTLEEIHAVLKTLRETPGSRRRFPKKLWNSILELAKSHSHKEICRQLEIQPVYLKRKMQKSQNSSPKNIDFQEIFFESQKGHANTVVIELISKSGLKAKIQGSSSCLSCLSSLFEGK
jgi:hypothetical protein